MVFVPELGAGYSQLQELGRTACLAALHTPMLRRLAAGASSPCKPCLLGLTIFVIYMIGILQI